jgi:hypothetical protein
MRQGTPAGGRTLGASAVQSCPIRLSFPRVLRMDSLPELPRLGQAGSLTCRRLEPGNLILNHSLPRSTRLRWLPCKPPCILSSERQCGELSKWPGTLTSQNTGQSHVRRLAGSNKWTVDVFHPWQSLALLDLSFVRVMEPPWATAGRSRALTFAPAFQFSIPSSSSVSVSRNVIACPFRHAAQSRNRLVVLV